MSFELPKLPYDYNALEPHIDAKNNGDSPQSKHHNGYTNNLNNAISNSDFADKSIEEICSSSGLTDAIRNNGGGYYNHCLFWRIMSPDGGEAPQEKLEKLINETFGSFENFKNEFSKAAFYRFGSGWAWLCDCDGELKICTTANQDNPLMEGQCGGTPLMCLDVWEHAYYLNYQNRRPSYIEAFFNVINWEEINNIYGRI